MNQGNSEVMLQNQVLEDFPGFDSWEVDGEEHGWCRVDGSSTHSLMAASSPCSCSCPCGRVLWLQGCLAVALGIPLQLGFMSGFL